MQSSTATSTVLRFGPFEMDAGSEELRRDGVAVKLEPQPFAVLCVLARRPGELVTRDELRDALWPQDTFVEFDHSLNTAVKKIRQALGDTAQSPSYVETLPRRGYRLVALVEAVDRALPPSERPRDRRWVIGAIAALAALAAVVGWSRFSRAIAEDPTLRPEVLTSYPGYEYAPSFSPDGSQVAFAWCRDEDCGVYIKQIGVYEPSRFADGPDREFSPAWSPDGETIAFVRAVSEKREIEIVLRPNRGGWERVLAQFPEPNFDIHPGAVQRLSWLPDSRRLVVAAPGDSRLLNLFVVGVTRQEVRPLTEAPLGVAESSPSVSPDGGTVAFNRFGSGVFLLRLNEEAYGEGEPVHIADALKPEQGLAWTVDGAQVVLGRGFNGLQRQTPMPGHAGSQLASKGDYVCTPAVSPSGRRLAYVASIQDWNIWRVRLGDDGTAAGEPTKLVESTHWDVNPAYSPDGRRIAFMSTRSGYPEIWVADADGSNPYQLTSFDGPWVAEPQWSPDGEKVAFYSTAARNKDIYVVDSGGGGRPKQITTHPLADYFPQWSSGGQWVEFLSDRSDVRQRWRIRADGAGDAEPLPIADSPDGRYGYFWRNEAQRGSVWKEPVEGGRPTKLTDMLPQGIIRVFEDGLYYLSTPTEDGSSDIMFYRFATEEHEVLGRTAGPADFFSLAISPDRRSILWVQEDVGGSDLMLVENFR